MCKESNEMRIPRAFAKELLTEDGEIVESHKEGDDSEKRIKKHVTKISKLEWYILIAYIVLGIIGVIYGKPLIN